jgi:hypothetical protein
MAQLQYGYEMQKAVPGGLRDTSPHSIVARANAEATAGAVKFGMGVVVGDTPGTNVKLPAAGATSAAFEGVVCQSVKEMDMQGKLSIDNAHTLGVLKYGRVWVRVAPSLTINYGDQMYLLTSGANIGCFTNAAANAVAVNGKFYGAAEATDIAPAEFFNAPYVAPAEASA